MDKYHAQLEMVMNQVTGYYSQLTAEQIAYAFIVNHAVMAARSQIRLLPRAPFFSGFLCMVLSGLGGSIIASLLNGDAPVFIGNDMFMATFFSVWTLMNFVPFKLLYHLANFFPIALVSYVLEGIFLGQVVCGAVDASVQRYPTSHLTPILLATLSGCGGTLLGGAVRKALGSTEPHELVEPTWLSRSVLFSSVAYYVAKYLLNYQFDQFDIIFNNKTYVVKPTPQHAIYALFVFLFLYSFFSGLFTRSGAAAAAKPKETKPASAVKLTKEELKEKKNK